VLTGKILIADDEQTELDFFCVMLSHLGFEVVMAEDGERALHLIKKDRVTWSRAKLKVTRPWSACRLAKPRVKPK